MHGGLSALPDPSWRGRGFRASGFVQSPTRFKASITNSQERRLSYVLRLVCKQIRLAEKIWWLNHEHCLICLYRLPSLVRGRRSGYAQRTGVHGAHAATQANGRGSGKGGVALIWQDTGGLLRWGCCCKLTLTCLYCHEYSSSC